MQLIPDTPFEFGYLVWQVRPPRYSLTVVLKGTFEIGAGKTCTLADEQAPVQGPLHFDEDEELSMRFETDLAVLKPQGECILAGTCHPPGGRAVATSAVNFKLGRVQKALAVFGDRFWRGTVVRTMTEPTPFTTMPLCHERSFGGRDFDANPLGCGIDEVSGPNGSVRPVPNLEDPRALIANPTDRPAPATFFPLLPSWRARMAKTGTYDKRWLKERWPFFPEDFDWTYFNAAPADQQIQGYWRGDEELQLQNLVPERPNVTTRLPGLRARLYVERARQRGLEEVAMNLDTVNIDTDALRVFCVWRGMVEIATDDASDIRRVFTAHESLKSPRDAIYYDGRYAQRLRELEVEDRTFYEDPEGTMIGPEAPHIESTMIDSALFATKVGERPARPPAEVDTSVAQLRESLAAAGVDLAEVDAPSPAPADPAQIAKSFESVGLEIPPELAAALATPDAEPPPAHTQRDLRAEVIAKLSRGESLAGEDLTEADLRELDLHGVDFSGAVLSRALFDRSLLAGAKFDKAVLAAASLQSANAEGASFANADLTQAALLEANLAQASLAHATLERCYAAGARFAAADLSEVEASEGNFTGCCFDGAKLDGGDFTRARFDRSTFVSASLVDATFCAVVAPQVVMDDADITKLRAFDRSNFEGATFRKVKGAGSRWESALLGQANFSLSDLERADFASATLARAKFDGANLKKASFRRAQLAGATMLGANAFAAQFDGADLTSADLRGSNFFGAEFWKAKTDGARLELANLERTKLAPVSTR